MGILAALVREDIGWVGAEIDLQRRAELEEAAFHRVPDVVNAALEGVLADHLREVVLELPLALVTTAAERWCWFQTTRSGKVTSGALILLSIRLFQYWNPNGELVDRGVRENRIHREIRQLQVIHGEVAVVQVAGAVRLIVLAIVGLRRVAEVGALFAAEIQSARPL